MWREIYHFSPYLPEEHRAIFATFLLRSFIPKPTTKAQAFLGRLEGDASLRRNMSKILKPLLALVPLACPPLLILLLLIVIDKYDSFGDRSDIPLFSFALALQALYANFKASNNPAQPAPSWIGWSWAGACAAFLFSGFSVVLCLLTEFKMLHTDLNLALSRIALLHLGAFVISVATACAAEYASA